MTKKELNQFRKYFELKKETILNQLSKQEQDLDVDGDDVDKIQGMILNLVNEKLSARDILMLKKIEIALTKIEDGSFGMCEECGDPISKKRLEVRPESSTCILCAERLEKLNKQFAC
jgi:DnaK suppressor protein